MEGHCRDDNGIDKQHFHPLDVCASHVACLHMHTHTLTGKHTTAHLNGQAALHEEASIPLDLARVVIRCVSRPIVGNGYFNVAAGTCSSTGNFGVSNEKCVGAVEIAVCVNLQRQCKSICTLTYNRADEMR